MNSDRNENGDVARSVKSVAQIRALLQSIHIRNEPRPAGSYVNGLPTAERNAIHAVTGQILANLRQRVERRARSIQQIHDAEYFRRVLLNCSTRVGAVAGSFLGANFGFGFSIISESINLLPIWILLGASMGCVIGIVVARSIVFQRRVDLFR